LKALALAVPQTIPVAQVAPHFLAFDVEGSNGRIGSIHSRTRALTSCGRAAWASIVAGPATGGGTRAGPPFPLDLGDDASEFLGGIVRLIAQDRSVHLGSPLAVGGRLRTASALDRSELGGVEVHRDNATTKTPSSSKCITGDTV